MNTADVLELAAIGEVTTAQRGKCPICDSALAGEVVLSAAGARAVHATCAAPVLALAHKSAGREPMRHVSGVVCGVCRRAFRYADQVVIVGREGCKTALHVRRCTGRR